MATVRRVRTCPLCGDRCEKGQSILGHLRYYHEEDGDKVMFHLALALHKLLNRRVPHD